MSGFTMAAKAKILNNLFEGKTYYAGLLTTITTGANGKENATELVSASYARRAINFASTSSNETSNVASVKFPEAREDWGRIIGIGIYDSLTGGNLINYATFDARDEVIIYALMQYEIAKNFYVIGFRN